MIQTSLYGAPYSATVVGGLHALIAAIGAQDGFQTAAGLAFVGQGDLNLDHPEVIRVAGNACNGGEMFGVFAVGRRHLVQLGELPVIAVGGAVKQYSAVAEDTEIVRFGRLGQTNFELAAGAIGQGDRTAHSRMMVGIVYRPADGIFNG
jgi:hypothetical protein